MLFLYSTLSLLPFSPPPLFFHQKKSFLFILTAISISHLIFPSPHKGNSFSHFIIIIIIIAMNIHLSILFRKKPHDYYTL